MATSDQATVEKVLQLRTHELMALRAPIVNPAKLAYWGVSQMEGRYDDHFILIPCHGARLDAGLSDKKKKKKKSHHT